MDLKQVEKSLENYWAGNSTEKEELDLRDFFSYGELPAHLEMYKEVFTSPDIVLNPALGKDFDKEILEQIENKNQNNQSSFWNAFKIAAIGLVLIIASISVFKLDRQEQLAEDTFTNPEDALQETKKAFLLIAEAMNKGEQPINHFSKLDETNKKISKK